MQLHCSAVGEAIPPMEIFPGTRFKYNPMLNCVEGAYFGHSPSGWSTAELFYGWITNHFSKKVTIRPVVLLVDGHTSHIDLHTSTYCKENNILLYCLPPHSSHLTQPFDVSFYKPLKAAWGKACTSYSTQHPGYQVTKHEFSQVFREAWISCVKLSTIIHGFEGAGLYPFNPSKVITEDKLLSSMQFSAKKSIPVQSIDHLAVFESVLSEEKVKKFQERYEEGFDVVSDELYCAWKKMKELSLVDTTPASSAQPPTTDGASNSEDTALKGSVLDDILVYPGIPENKRSGGRSKALPACLSGEQFVQYLLEKKDEKDKKEEEKRQRQIEREQKKKERQLLKAQREEEKKKKQLEREKKKEQAALQSRRSRRGRGQGRNLRSGRGCARPQTGSEKDCRQQRECRRGRGCGQARGHRSAQDQPEDSPSEDRQPGNDHLESSSSSDYDGSPGTASSGEDSSSDGYLCAVCFTDSDGKWVQCDRCDTWFHCSCVNLQNDLCLDSVDWYCSKC